MANVYDLQGREINVFEIHVTQDTFPDPPDWEGWYEIHSFAPAHSNYKSPNRFGLVMKDGRITSTDPGIRSKLRAGTAIILSAYQHGGIVWSLATEGQQCRFDTAPVAGIMFVRWMRQSKESRLEMARDFLPSYNAWCNGETYGIRVYRNGEAVEYFPTIGGRIEKDLAYIKESWNLPADFPVTRIE